MAGAWEKDEAEVLAHVLEVLLGVGHREAGSVPIERLGYCLEEAAKRSCGRAWWVRYAVIRYLPSGRLFVPSMSMNLEQLVSYLGSWTYSRCSA